MAITACPFCFRKIDSSRLAYQCVGRGNIECKKSEDDARVNLTGSKIETYPTFLPDSKGGITLGGSRNGPPPCPNCGGPAKRRACPACHTALPIDFVDSKSPMIGLVGATGSGKTVLMTVLVKQLREVVGRRFNADIRIATDNPDGHTGLSDYQASRETPLYTGRALPPKTNKQGRWHTPPVVLRWRQESGRLIGGQTLQSTVLSFVDTAGEDLNDQGTTFTLEYLSVCDALMIALDPFAIPGARAQLNLPQQAIQVGDDVPLDVVSNITELLRTEHGVKKRKRIKLPVAIVFTKIDAFYPSLDRHNPIMTRPREVPAYQEEDGRTVHEHILALMQEWNATDIDTHVRLNYTDYRYFGVSALGAEPDYVTNAVAVGGVQPHRVEDPVLWLLAKTKTVSAT
jgi:ABC-type dipeptide/oligopeptide/nickel transport system ATPase component